jgi:hypothetical protein
MNGTKGKKAGRLRDARKRRRDEREKARKPQNKRVYQVVEEKPIKKKAYKIKKKAIKVRIRRKTNRQRKRK